MFTKLVMLGAAPESRGGVASVVAAYRDHGLFSRWPIEYIATRGAPGERRSGLRTLGALLRFVKQLALHRGVVLHVHAEAGLGLWRDLSLAAAAIGARCPVLLHLHGGGFDELHAAWGDARRGAMRFVLERVACVAAPSQRLLAWVRGLCPRARTLWLPHPVPATPPARGPRQNLVLFLGRLRAEKGIFELLEAVAQVRAAVPDVRLVCAGDGARLTVARYAERLGIADAVKFTGWVGPSGKRALFESAAVYALPSYAEGLPMSLLEAMAAGVPALASPVGGVPEVLTDGVSGFLAAPGDVATLTRVLRKLLIDRALAERVGAAGREAVLGRFSPERVLPRLEALYAELGLRALGAPWPASQAG